MGPNKKKFKTRCHLTFLEKKSLDPTPPSKKSQIPKKKIDF
jgi:hypothetical protein